MITGIHRIGRVFNQIPTAPIFSYTPSIIQCRSSFCIELRPFFPTTVLQQYLCYSSRKGGFYCGERKQSCYNFVVAVVVVTDSIAMIEYTVRENTTLPSCSFLSRFPAWCTARIDERRTRPRQQQQRTTQHADNYGREQQTGIPKKRNKLRLQIQTPEQ